jgi:hypothetical protein
MLPGTYSFVAWPRLANLVMAVPRIISQVIRQNGNPPAPLSASREVTSTRHNDVVQIRGSHTLHDILAAAVRLVAAKQRVAGDLLREELGVEREPLALRWSAS